MPTVWLMLLANVRSSLAVLTCCEASMSGYFHVGLRDTAPGTWQRPPSRASNGTPRENMRGVDFEWLIDR